VPKSVPLGIGKVSGRLTFLRFIVPSDNIPISFKFKWKWRAQATNYRLSKEWNKTNRPSKRIYWLIDLVVKFM